MFEGMSKNVASLHEPTLIPACTSLNPKTRRKLSVVCKKHLQAADSPGRRLARGKESWKPTLGPRILLVKNVAHTQPAMLTVSGAIRRTPALHQALRWIVSMMRKSSL